MYNMTKRNTKVMPMKLLSKINTDTFIQDNSLLRLHHLRTLHHHTDPLKNQGVDPVYEHRLAKEPVLIEMKGVE